MFVLVLLSFFSAAYTLYLCLIISMDLFILVFILVP